MSNSPPPIDWFGAFDVICRRENGALKWGLPEPWLQTELFAELDRRSSESGWVPIPQEVPYVTHYPVQTPAETHRDWKIHGAVKWVDLCLQHPVTNTWCWFELKVRPCGDGDRLDRASIQARDAFRKDVVALTGFDVGRTATAWADPDEATKIYWAETLLKPHKNNILSGRHEFVAAYLQLNGEMNSGHWAEMQFRGVLEAWLRERSKKSLTKRVLPAIRFESPPQLIAGQHSLVIGKWSLPDAQLIVSAPGD